MANRKPDPIPIEKPEWKKEFGELARQASSKEIFASVWFQPNHLVRTIVSQLRADELAIHLYLPQPKRPGGFCAEIVIQAPRPDDEEREFQLYRTPRGDVYLWMQQGSVILALSNSWELIDLLESDTLLQ